MQLLTYDLFSQTVRLKKAMQLLYVTRERPEMCKLVGI
jgi:hypothetical protein